MQTQKTRRTITWTFEKNLALARGYRDGMTGKELALLFEISTSQVASQLRRLRAAGVELPKRAATAFLTKDAVSKLNDHLTGKTNKNPTRNKEKAEPAKKEKQETNPTLLPLT